MLSDDRKWGAKEASHTRGQVIKDIQDVRRMPSQRELYNDRYDEALRRWQAIIAEQEPRGLQ